MKTPSIKQLIEGFHCKQWALLGSYIVASSGSGLLLLSSKFTPQAATPIIHSQVIIASGNGTESNITTLEYCPSFMGAGDFLAIGHADGSIDLVRRGDLEATIDVGAKHCENIDRKATFDMLIAATTVHTVNAALTLGGERGKHVIAGMDNGAISALCYRPSVFGVEPALFVGTASGQLLIVDQEASDGRPRCYLVNEDSGGESGGAQGRITCIAAATWSEKFAASGVAVVGLASGNLEVWNSGGQKKCFAKMLYAGGVGNVNREVTQVVWDPNVTGKIISAHRGEDKLFFWDIRYPHSPMAKNPLDLDGTVECISTAGSAIGCPGPMIVTTSTGKLFDFKGPARQGEQATAVEIPFKLPFNSGVISIMEAGRLVLFNAGEKGIYWTLSGGAVPGGTEVPHPSPVAHVSLTRTSLLGPDGTVVFENGEALTDALSAVDTEKLRCLARSLTCGGGADFANAEAERATPAVATIWRAVGSWFQSSSDRIETLREALSKARDASISLDDPAALIDRREDCSPVLRRDSLLSDLEVPSRSTQDLLISTLARGDASGALSVALSSQLFLEALLIARKSAAMWNQTIHAIQDHLEHSMPIGGDEAFHQTTFFLSICLDREDLEPYISGLSDAAIRSDWTTAVQMVLTYQFPDSPGRFSLATWEKFSTVCASFADRLESMLKIWEASVLRVVGGDLEGALRLLKFAQTMNDGAIFPSDGDRIAITLLLTTAMQMELPRDSSSDIMDAATHMYRNGAADDAWGLLRVANIQDPGPPFGRIQLPRQQKHIETIQQRASPFGNQQTSGPFANQRQPSAYGNQQQPSGPFGNQQQPSGPFGNQQQPSGPFGNQQQPPGLFGNQQQPPGPFGNQQQPPGPFGNQQQPPGPFGNQQQPPGPSGHGAPFNVRGGPPPATAIIAAPRVVAGPPLIGALAAQNSNGARSMSMRQPGQIQSSGPPPPMPTMGGMPMAPPKMEQQGPPKMGAVPCQTSNLQPLAIPPPAMPPNNPLPSGHGTHPGMGQVVTPPPPPGMGLARKAGPGMGMQPPGMGMQPPGMGMQPPGMGMQPPGMGMQPPGMGMQPPGMGMQPPGMGMQPPGMGHVPGPSMLGGGPGRIGVMASSGQGNLPTAPTLTTGGENQGLPTPWPLPTSTQNQAQTYHSTMSANAANQIKSLTPAMMPTPQQTLILQQTVGRFPSEQHQQVWTRASDAANSGTLTEESISALVSIADAVGAKDAQRAKQAFDVLWMSAFSRENKPWLQQLKHIFG